MLQRSVLREKEGCERDQKDKRLVHHPWYGTRREGTASNSFGEFAMVALAPVFLALREAILPRLRVIVCQREFANGIQAVIVFYKV